MNKSCACSGIRTCLRCENGDQHTDKGQQHELEHIFNQCYRCGLIKKADYDSMIANSESSPLVMCISSKCTEKQMLKSYFDFASHSLSLMFQGLTLIKDFVSEHEEQELLAEIDRNQWAESQSGRLKQVHDLNLQVISCRCYK